MIAALMAALMMAVSIRGAPKLGPFDGFGRGIHVFGDYVVDLGWGAQYWDVAMSGHRVGGPPWSGSSPSAEVCNTPEYFCIRSSDPKALVQLVVPRRCRSLRVGDTFSAAGRRMVVLSANPGSPMPINHPWPPSYLLGDMDRKDVVFEYKQSLGVTGFFYSTVPDMDLQKLARGGLLYAARNGTDGHLSWWSFSISSPDIFAGCEFQKPSLRRG